MVVVGDRSASDEFLHVKHIEPAIEFVADFPEVADLDEAETGVKPNAGFVGAVDDGDEGVEPSLAGGSEEGRHEGFSESVPAMVCGDVDGILSGETITEAIVKPADGTPAHDRFTGLRDKDRVVVLCVIIEPRVAMFEASRFDVVGSRGRQYRVVIDGED